MAARNAACSPRQKPTTLMAASGYPDRNQSNTAATSARICYAVVASLFNQIGELISQRSRTGKQRDTEGLITLGSQVIGNGANTDIHTANIRQHVIDTIY